MSQSNKRFSQLVKEAVAQIKELLPWDLEENPPDKETILLDVREPYEFHTMHIQHSINVPRGILETACEYGFEETVPALAASRDQKIIIICRSGNRSALAAVTMQQMGFNNVYSLKTGLRGWNEYEMPLVDAQGETVSIDDADEYHTSRVRPDQREPD